MEIAVPKQTTRYTFEDGRSHEISLIEAMEAATAILKKRESETGFAYVDDFKVWWETHALTNGSDKSISRDEAAWLCDMIFVEADRQKKSRVGLLQSSISTEPSQPA